MITVNKWDKNIGDDPGFMAYSGTTTVFHYTGNGTVLLKTALGEIAVSQFELTNIAELCAYADKEVNGPLLS